MIKNKTDLKNALATVVRTGGKTKAADMRILLADLIDTLFPRVKTINGIAPDPVTGNIEIPVSASTPAAAIAEKQLQFDTNIIVPHYQGFFGKHQLLSDTLPNEISSVAYFTQVDSSTNWIPQTGITAINDWVCATITENVHWRLKTVPTANTTAGTGLCEIIRRTKKL